VTWEEIEHGIAIEDFRMDNMRARLRDAGDLWKPLVSPRGRLDLKPFLNALKGVGEPEGGKKGRRSAQGA
jgi:DNA primase